MTRPIDLLREGRKEELWQMCCGFLDLSLEEFMAIQKRLLLEQIGLLKNCELGRKVMHGAMPATVEEFREQVPFTTYADYLPELVEKREDVLPARVARWVRTSGHAGDYDVKWVPMSDDFASECEKLGAAVVIFSTCDSKGDTSKIKEHFKLLFSMGTPEYVSGAMVYLMRQALGCDLLPLKGEGMQFQERMKAGFAEALYRGLDMIGGLPSVLVAVGEQFKQRSGKRNIRPLVSHPKALFRIMRAVATSKLHHRAMLPRDMWSLKGIAGSGTDSGVFRKKVEELWGRPLLEMYSSTEGGYYAIQTWDYEGMTFVPNLNFYEFIPEREWFKWQLDRSYQPRTILMDEVKAGEKYEIIITNFHGGVMTRYRVGDMVRITSLRNEKLNIDIPQMVFERRADELIDIFGFGHITEKLIWQAIENTGIPYVDWTARKEISEDKPTLHIYLELGGDYIASEKSVEAAVYKEFQKLDSIHNFNLYKFAYGEAAALIDLKPIKITFLPRGASARYISRMRAEGADLGHIKAPHINPSDEILSILRSPVVEVEAIPAAEAERESARAR
jgi:hypothetical protein